MKNSSDTIGNETRDLPVCSAVPQPTAPPAACPTLRCTFRVFCSVMESVSLTSCSTQLKSLPMNKQMKGLKSLTSLIKMEQEENQQEIKFCIKYKIE
jgi:hypothetical protein